MYKNFAPGLPDGHGMYLCAVRPDHASGVAFMHSLLARLRSDPRTADLYNVFVLSAEDGDSFVWLKSK